MELIGLVARRQRHLVELGHVPAFDNMAAAARICAQAVHHLCHLIDAFARFVQPLAHLPPERLRFRLQPHLQLLTFAYPVDQLITKLRQRQTESASNAATGKRRASSIRLQSRPAREPIYIAAYRRENSVRYRRMEPVAFQLLSALGKGTPLAEACESAFAHSTLAPEAAAACIRTWFAEWTSLHWLTPHAR